MQVTSNPLFSQEAEESVIGGLLIDSSNLPEVLEVVQPKDFYFARTRAVYEVIESLGDKDSQIDVITVSQSLIDSKNDESFFNYCVEIASKTASAANLKAYGAIIKEKSIKRSVVAMSNLVCEYVTTHSEATKDEVINFAQTAMMDFESGQSDEYVAHTMKDTMKRYVTDLDNRFKNGAALTGYSSGFDDIDAVTNGWRKGELIIIAARPSMGKSTYALQSASLMSMHQKLNGLFFSLEMSESQLMEKLMACHGGIPLNMLKSPSQYNTEQMWPKLEGAACKLKDIPLKIVNCPGIHINQLKSYARKMHRRSPLDYIVVDHIHLMSFDGDDDVKGLGKISSTLKALSGQLDIPVIALAQLNRGVEQRPDKRPLMSDLRGSGSIEQDADIIQFVYRDDYYNEDDMNPNKGLVMIDTQKNRMGERGQAFLENRYDESRLEPSKRGMQMNARGVSRNEYLDKL